MIRQGIMLKSPGGSFLAINVLGDDEMLMACVDEAAEAMNAEYEDIESEPYEIDRRPTVHRYLAALLLPRLRGRLQTLYDRLGRAAPAGSNPRRRPRHGCAGCVFEAICLRLYERSCPIPILITYSLVPEQRFQMHILRAAICLLLCALWLFGRWPRPRATGVAGRFCQGRCHTDRTVRLSGYGTRDQNHTGIADRLYARAWS